MTNIDVVSNTSPLVFLEKIDSLQLLDQCFHSVVIPESVAHEWKKHNLPAFIQLRAVSELGKSFVDGAIGRLHRGELEAIRLAQERNCKVVLLDDLLARRYAERHGLIPLGVLGILKIANRLEYLPLDKLKEKVSDLITHHDLFISQKVLNQYWTSF
ncbi:DUF3368 domain-containing protein [Deltaproteobacteria bacterium TL4]